MGMLIDARSPAAIAARPAAWGLVTKLVERKPPRSRKAVVYLDDRPTACTVAEIPAVGDLIHGSVASIVDKVKVRRDGCVLVYTRTTSNLREAMRQPMREQL